MPKSVFCKKDVFTSKCLIASKLWIKSNKIKLHQNYASNQYIKIAKT